MPAPKATEGMDGSPDGVFAGPLADLGDISPREAVGELHKQVYVHVWRNGALAQHRLEDLPAAGLIRQRDVNQLIQASRSQQGRIDDIGPVHTHTCHNLRTVNAVDTYPSSPSTLSTQPSSPSTLWTHTLFPVNTVDTYTSSPSTLSTHTPIPSLRSPFAHTSVLLCVGSLTSTKHHPVQQKEREPVQVGYKIKLSKDPL